jgi:hypothetical protein
MEDPWGQIGRALVLILAFTMPFVGRLDSVPLSTGRVLPAASLLGLIIPLFAIASAATGGAKRLYGRWMLPIVLAFGLLAGLGATTYGRDPILSVAALWEPTLLVAGVAVLFAGHPTERLALFATLILSTLFAVTLGFGELFRIQAFENFVSIFHDSPETWQLLLRLTGPLSHAEALAWLCAVLIPVLAGAAMTVHGKKREILLLLLGIFWLATLLTLSFGAPIAALAGTLVVMTTRASIKRSVVGFSVPLILGVLVATMNPAFRARWGPYQEPVGFTVQALTALESVSEDSLAVTLVNPGPVSWEKGFETGYHVLYPESQDDREPVKLLRGGWISKTIDQHVAPGEEVSITLPFRSHEESGFIVLDLKGPGGLFSQYRGSPYLLLFQSDLPGETNRLGRLMHVRSEKYVRAANDALNRGSGLNILSMTEIWRDVYSLLGARPWFGLGPGASESLLGYNSRNLFLEITVSGGWIGLGLSVILILGLNIGLLVRESLEGYVLSGAIFAAVLHGMSAFALDDPSVRAAAMLLIGVAWAVAFEPLEADAVASADNRLRLRWHPFWRKDSNSST